MASTTRTKSTAARRTPVDLPSVARWVRDSTVLFTPDSPFRLDIADGDPRLLLITGENASGKSLVARLLAAKVAKANAVPVSISIRERTGGGMRAVFMFGDEAHQSTGATSLEVITKAFGANLDRPQGSVLLLDEPELGLSSGYTRALGRYIGEQAATVPATCDGVVIVTHSHDLVEGLLSSYPRTPTHLSLGAPAGVSTWLSSTETRTVEDLLALARTGDERHTWAAAAMSRQ